MVRVSIRPAQPDGDAEATGNAVGAALCDLGTEPSDVGQRLTRIQSPMAHTNRVRDHDVERRPHEGVGSPEQTGRASPAMLIALNPYSCRGVRFDMIPASIRGYCAA